MSLWPFQPEVNAFFFFFLVFNQSSSLSPHTSMCIVSGCLPSDAGGGHVFFHTIQDMLNICQHLTLKSLDCLATNLKQAKMCSAGNVDCVSAGFCVLFCCE